MSEAPSVVLQLGAPVAEILAVSAVGPLSSCSFIFNRHARVEGLARQRCNTVRLCPQPKSGETHHLAEEISQ